MNFVSGRIQVIFMADFSSNGCVSKAGVKEREANPDTLAVENSCWSQAAEIIHTVSTFLDRSTGPDSLSVTH